jgi:glycosyltransferase involved in cell wall biosynthesis
MLAKRNVTILPPKLLLDLLWQCIRLSGCTVLHVCELRGLVPLYALAVKRLFPHRVALIHSAFGMLHYRKSRIRAIYDRFFLFPFVRAVDVALAQNEHETNVYRALQQSAGRTENVLVRPLHAGGVPRALQGNGAGCKRPDLVAALRAKHGAPVDELVIVFLGRFHPGKGLLRTIDAFGHWRRTRRRRARLLLVGRDDGFEARLRQYVGEQGLGSSVSIVTGVYDKRFEYYYLADVFVGLPTLFEETMLASVEALGCGTPIVVSREADIPFVQDGGAGFVIDYSLESVAQAIEAIVSAPEQFQTEAYRVAQRFASAAAANELLSLIEGQASGLRWEGRRCG